LRAMNGVTDGGVFPWLAGDLRQQVFRAPSVFNFFPPDYPVAGTGLIGPQFGILNANTGMARVNFINALVIWESFTSRDATIPNATGTQVNLQAFEADAANPTKLVDRFLKLAVAGRMPAASRTAIINAVNAIPVANNATYARDRTRTAAYLVFASPQFQVTR
jgi:Protein of unknown function (DUF1800)